MIIVVFVYQKLGRSSRVKINKFIVLPPMDSVGDVDSLNFCNDHRLNGRKLPEIFPKNNKFSLTA